MKKILFTMFLALGFCMVATAVQAQAVAPSSQKADKSEMVKEYKAAQKNSVKLTETQKDMAIKAIKADEKMTDAEKEQMIKKIQESETKEESAEIKSKRAAKAHIEKAKGAKKVE